MDFGSEKPSFAKLVVMFVVKAEGQQVLMALVQGADKGIGGRPRVVDRDFGLHRLKMWERTASRFIPLQSIIRGALVAHDSQNHDEYVIVDIIDPDMFLRVRAMYPDRYLRGDTAV